MSMCFGKSGNGLLIWGTGLVLDLSLDYSCSAEYLAEYLNVLNKSPGMSESRFTVFFRDL